MHNDILSWLLILFLWRHGADICCVNTVDLWHVRSQKRHVNERDFRIKTNKPQAVEQADFSCTLSATEVRMDSTLLNIFVFCILIPEVTGRELNQTPHVCFVVETQSVEKAWFLVWMPVCHMVLEDKNVTKMNTSWNSCMSIKRKVYPQWTSFTNNKNVPFKLALPQTVACYIVVSQWESLAPKMAAKVLNMPVNVSLAFSNH